MAIELNTNPAVRDVSAVSSVPAAAQNNAAPAQTEEAYEVSVDKEAPSKFKVDYDKISALKAESQRGYNAMRQMVSALLQKQGKEANVSLGMIFGKDGNFDGVTNLGKVISSLNVDEATRAEAQKMVAEDGPYGVKQVSENILSFAKAVAGDDKAQLQKMKDAFLKGFDEAERVWGGKLPEISYKTKEAVLEGFKKLENGEE